MSELSIGLKVAFAALCSTVLVAHATNTNITSPNPASMGWFVGMQSGAFWADLPSGLTVNNGAPYASPYNLDQYSLNDKTTATLSLLAGYKWNTLNQWLPGYAVALNYQHFFANNVNGSITQYSLPQFTNYNYSLDVNSDVFSLYSKFDLFHYARLIPFLDLGLGVAMNHANSYGEIALPGVTPRESPRYRNHTESNFAYRLGFGVDYVIKPNLLVSLSYAYQDLGSVHSGNGVTTWSRERLQLGHYKGNSVNFGLTYGLNT
ncbi:MAG: outer membrane beta-barrel protein [bacterium]|nr:outer membrane beta-barrel protein [bacterium]